MTGEKNVLVIVGLPCSGKTTISNLFRKSLISRGVKCEVKKISDLVKVFCKDGGVKTTRSNLKIVKDAFCSVYGLDCWARLLFNDFSRGGSDYLVVDGAWVKEEIFYLSKLKNCKILALSASRDELEKRLILRNESAQEQARVIKVQRNFSVRIFFDLASKIWNTECPIEKIEKKIELYW